jgi:hypothetical protein
MVKVRIVSLISCISIQNVRPKNLLKVFKNIECNIRNRIRFTGKND